MNSTIHLLNNWGLDFNIAFFLGGGGGGGGKGEVFVAASTVKSIILKLDIAMFISLDTLVQDCSQQHSFTKHNLFLNLICNAIIYYGSCLLFKLLHLSLFFLKL